MSAQLNSPLSFFVTIAFGFPDSFGCSRFFASIVILSFVGTLWMLVICAQQYSSRLWPPVMSANPLIVREGSFRIASWTWGVVVSGGSLLIASGWRTEKLPIGTNSSNENCRPKKGFVKVKVLNITQVPISVSLTSESIVPARLQRTFTSKLAPPESPVQGLFRRRQATTGLAVVRQ